MKIYHDPLTGQVITKQEAINIATLQGKILVEEEMTLSEARRRGYDLPNDFDYLSQKEEQERKK